MSLLLPWLRAADNNRTASDSVTTSDSATAVQSLVRSASDAVTTSSVVTATSHTAADAVTTSDSATRVVAATRTETDAVTTSDVVTGSKSLHRTAGDAVTTSDAATRALVLHRTTADSVAISTSVIGYPGRSFAADAIRISDSAVVVSDNFRVTASDAIGIGDSVDAPTATTGVGGGGVGGGGTGFNTTYVYIGGTYIGGSSVPGAGSGGGTGSGNAMGQIEFATATFTQYVNGKPGEAYMRVRDLDSSISFTEGDDWVMMVNGQVAWRGFVTQVIETYYADVVDLALTSPMRVIDLRGTDLNILFSRRVMFRKSDPANAQGQDFPAGTHDTTAITKMVNDWLDLSDSSIDVVSGVVHVGDLDPDQASNLWSGGWTWGNGMDQVAMLPAAIYYIRPQLGSPHGVLVYGDVDVPTAPFGLSDNPGFSAGVWKGYREMEITLDGTSLANDVFGWGKGYGSQTPVFDRETDDPSVSLHGLWQTASDNYGVYKQGTIDRIVESILDGSPTSHRGAKDDRPYVTLVTYEPGLLAGQVVSFESLAWGFSDNIPIRQLTLTFQAPDVPRYELILSHEIDAPWGFIDQFWPRLPGFPPIPGPPRLPPPGHPQPQPSECVCGITDDFQRTESGQWGLSTAKVEWSGTAGGIGEISVDPITGGKIGLIAEASASGPNGDRTQTVVFPQTVTMPIEMAMGIIVPTVSEPSSEVSFIFGNSQTAKFAYSAANHSISMDGWVSFSPSFALDLSSGMNLRLRIENDTSLVMMYRAWGFNDPEPTTWDNTFTDTALDSSVSDALTLRLLQNRTTGSSYAEFAARLFSLDIVGIDLCSAPQFDDFNRVCFGSAGVDLAGTSTPSDIVWKATAFPGGTDFGVNGAQLYVGLTGGTIHIRTPISGGPWQTSDTITFETRFTFFQQSGVLANFPAFQMELRDASNNNIGWQFQVGGTGGGFILYSSPSAGVVLYSLPASWLTFDYSVSSLYFHVKWQTTQSTGDVKAKVWLEADGEPADWQVIAGTGFVQPMDKSTSRFNVIIGSSFSNRAEYVDWINWDYTGKPCYYLSQGVPNNQPFTPPTNLIDWGGEYPTRISALIYQTAANYLAQTTMVWRNGLLQQRNVDYTENSDGRTLTFTTSVADTDIIRAYYFQQTSGGGVTGGSGGGTGTPPPPPSGAYTFQDEFDGPTLSPFWLPTYQPGDPGYGLDSDFRGDLSQVSIVTSGGDTFARITAHKVTSTGSHDWYSASMGTNGTFSQRFGTFEARVRYPSGEGVFPAFWLLQPGAPVTPPEIDIFEAFPGPGAGSSGLNYLSSGMNTTLGIYPAGGPGAPPLYFDARGDLTGNWHVHKMIWTPTTIQMLIDDIDRGTYTDAAKIATLPAMYPIFTFAVGAPSYRADGTTPTTMFMDIDYIRVSQ